MQGARGDGMQVGVDGSVRDGARRSGGGSNDGADGIGLAAARRMGAVLVSWRHALGWTQDELAGRAGISRGHLSRLERGATEQPGMDVLTRVCGATGHTWPELFAHAGVSLPGDVTFDDMHAGLNDPELVLYLRRVPELDARDRVLLRGILRTLFERDGMPSVAEPYDARQLAFPMGAAPLDDGTDD